MKVFPTLHDEYLYVPMRKITIPDPAALSQSQGATGPLLAPHLVWLT